MIRTKDELLAELSLGGSSGILVERNLIRDLVESVIYGSDDANINNLTAANLTVTGDTKIGNTAAAGTPTATHTLLIKDATGTSYKVLCVAA